jgi:peroxiredoxin
MVFFGNVTSLRGEPPHPGQEAPGFSLPGSDGKAHALGDYKGHIVVLEWTNPDCPFVKKWYGSGEMQKVQKKAVEEGVVWLRINSSAPGKQGVQTPPEAAAYEKAQHVAATVTLLDPEGKVGRLYGAHTTPHLFVIDKTGKLAYAGAIDSKPSADPADIPGAKNYVTAALEELAAGKPVSTPFTKAYGCSVKYAAP